MVFAAVLTHSRIVALSYFMTISLTIQTSSWIDAKVEREPTKWEMYILGLVQHGKTLLGTWISQSRVEGFRALGLFLKTRKALGSADEKRKLKEVSSFSLVTQDGEKNWVVEAYVGKRRKEKFGILE